MSYHVAAYTELLGTTANTDIDALTDDVLLIQNTHFVPQRSFDLAFIWNGSATLNRARLVTPKTRQITIPFIRPLDRSATPVQDPNVADYRGNPFRLVALEEIAIEATSDIATGTERYTAVVGLGVEFTPAPAGDVYNLRGTSTTAAVANAWTSITVTWADTLPAGEYAVIGGEVFSTNGIAWRAIYEGQYWRPGGTSISALANRTHAMFRLGGMGRHGIFTSTRMPIIQVLANAADAAHTAHLDIVKIR